MAKIIYFVDISILLLVFMTINSCKIEPEPIQFGHDECSFCKMTIVDKAHAAQLVTKKGKQFKYDAIECLVWNINEVPALAQKSILLVADYLDPGTMLPAEQAGYIISQRIKSPMGANLSAVARDTKADSLILLYGGDKYDWEQLLELLSE